MSLRSQIESLIFISTHSLTSKKIAELTGGDLGEVEKALSLIQEDYNRETSGIHLMKNGNQYQLVTAGANAQLVK